jgi:hypothetical protein
MAKRKNGKNRRSTPRKRRNRRAIYAKLKREFTAADLQKYTEIEEGIPLDKIIAEMEAVHQKYLRKRA